MRRTAALVAQRSTATVADATSRQCTVRTHREDRVHVQARYCLHILPVSHGQHGVFCSRSMRDQVYPCHWAAYSLQHCVQQPATVRVVSVSWVPVWRRAVPVVLVHGLVNARSVDMVCSCLYLLPEEPVHVSG